MPAFQNFTADRMSPVTPPNSNGWNIPLTIQHFALYTSPIQWYHFGSILIWAEYYFKGSVKWKKGGLSGINRWAFNLSTFPHIFYCFLNNKKTHFSGLTTQYAPRLNQGPSAAKKHDSGWVLPIEDNLYAVFLSIFVYFWSYTCVAVIYNSCIMVKLWASLMYSNDTH